MSQKPPGPSEADDAPRIAGFITPTDGAPAPPVPRWCCPLCGSDRLTVYYTERRASSVGTDPDTCQPCPDFARDGLVDIDPDLYVFFCEGCFTQNVDPLRVEMWPHPSGQDAVVPNGEGGKGLRQTPRSTRQAADAVLDRAIGSMGGGDRRRPPR